MEVVVGPTVGKTVKGLATLLVAAAVIAFGHSAAARPLPPCGPGQGAPVPAYGSLDGPPAFRVWHDIKLDSREECPDLPRGRMALVIALAGRFDGAKSQDDIAARIGAISAGQGLRYWSTTMRRWRKLITKAYALEDPNTRHRRPDFKPQEVLSGETLYFAQNDTFSTGLNVYGLTAKSVTQERLILEVVNASPIRLTVMPLFKARALRSVHYIDRLKSGAWSYYGVVAVRSGRTEGHEKSFVNRAAAYYRFLTETPPDREPPLAP